MQAMELNNVVVSERGMKSAQSRLPKLSTAPPITHMAHPALEPVILAVALFKPTWRFEADDPSRVLLADEHTAMQYCCFRVYEDGELLGRINREYARRDYKIMVQNERIDSKRERGRGYCTEDPKKAIARIKKEFGRLSTQERLDKASEAASNYVGNAYDRMHYQHREYKASVVAAANKYVMGPGFEVFMEYVRRELPQEQQDLIFVSNEKANAVHAEMAIMADIRARLGASEKSALVVRDFGEYIVRIGSAVNLCTDNDLPEFLKGKLGLLKLVEKEHFIEGVGCRVTDEIFVVVLDETTGDNNVSQGE
jgi:hypothetical protein